MRAATYFGIWWRNSQSAVIIVDIFQVKFLQYRTIRLQTDPNELKRNLWTNFSSFGLLCESPGGADTLQWLISTENAKMGYRWSWLLFS